VGRWPPMGHRSTSGRRPGRSWMRSSRGSGSCFRVADDAGHRDRRADRLDQGADGAQGSCRTVRHQSDHAAVPEPTPSQSRRFLTRTRVLRKGSSWAGRQRLGASRWPRPSGGRNASQRPRALLVAAQVNVGVAAGRMTVCRHSLSRLWAPHSSFHSALQAHGPSRRNLRAPWCSLSCPNAGSTVSQRLA